MAILVRRFRVKIKLVMPFALVGGFLMVCGTMFAHHSAAMYDREHPVTLKGTVTKLAFFNPRQGVGYIGAVYRGILGRSRRGNSGRGYIVDKPCIGGRSHRVAQRILIFNFHTVGGGIFQIVISSAAH